MPESSGVRLLPLSSVGRRLLDSSVMPLMPKLAIMPGASSGRAVLMLMVAPMPPAGLDAWLVFQTSSDDTDSAARLAKSKAREFDALVAWTVVAGIWRPFSRIML